MLAARAGRYDYQCHDKICHNALFCDAADIIFILSFFFHQLPTGIGSSWLDVNILD